MDALRELEKTTTATPRKEDRGALWIGFVFVGVAVLILAYQAYVWLRYGVWPSLPLSYLIEWLGWRRPSLDWIGIQNIIDWLLDLPVHVTPLLAAFGCFSAWWETAER